MDILPAYTRAAELSPAQYADWHMNGYFMLIRSHVIGIRKGRSHVVVSVRQSSTTDSVANDLARWLRTRGQQIIQEDDRGQ